MPDLNLLAILAATVLSFALGAVYYVILGDRLAEVSDAAAAEVKQPWWAVPVEVLRCLVIAAVAAGLAVRAEVDTWTGGLLLGLALWIGFPVVLWVGAVVHEKVPWRLAAIHAGDWLVKLLAVGAVVAVWQ